MSASKPNNLTLDRALKLLKSYDCAQATNTDLSIELEELRNSLLLVKSLSSSQNLGICADNSQQGFAALSSYLDAFSYPSNFDREDVSSSSKPVYIKFSTQKMSYYSKEYTGEYRGVLVSCQSEEDSIAGTYGHFPLNLFQNA